MENKKLTFENYLEFEKSFLGCVESIIGQQKFVFKIKSCTQFLQQVDKENLTALYADKNFDPKVIKKNNLIIIANRGIDPNKIDWRWNKLINGENLKDAWEVSFPTHYGLLFILDYPCLLDYISKESQQPVHKEIIKMLSCLPVDILQKMLKYKLLQHEQSNVELESLDSSNLNYRYMVCISDMKNALTCASYLQECIQLQVEKSQDSIQQSSNLQPIEEEKQVLPTSPTQLNPKQYQQQYQIGINQTLNISTQQNIWRLPLKKIREVPEEQEQSPRSPRK